MEDNINFRDNGRLPQLMEDYLNVKVNGRQPQFQGKWKMTSISR
jgi:hypothetical protein